jgi:hypothetical protein
MSEYDYRVDQQRLKLAAEEWAKGVKALHAHSLSSMWYDNRPQDTEGGRIVTDCEYNDGTIRRTLDNGEVVILGIELRGEDLVDAYQKHGR